MNLGRDILILVLVLIALAVAIASVKNSPIAFDLLTQNLSAPKSSGGSEYSNKRISERNSEKTSKQIERQIAEAESEIALIEEKLKEIEEFGEQSPYIGMVTMSKSASGPRSTDVDKERIELKVSTSVTRPLAISNWKLRSSITGRAVELGDAVTLFFSGDVNVETPLVVKAGNRVVVTTGRSPIGESFQINKCSGYFTQFQTFNPRISSQCPTPEEEILAYTRDESIFLDNECMDFVERIPRCRVQTKQLPLTLSFTCQDAIFEEINYNACIEKHKTDDDFYSGDWRVYLKRGSELWRDKREIILLVDENDLTVDHFSY